MKLCSSCTSPPSEKCALQSSQAYRAFASRHFQHLSTQIVHFDQANSGGIVYTAHDRGVVTWWQLRDDRRLIWVAGCMAASLDVADLVRGDNPADDRVDQLSLEAISSQCRRAVPRSDQPMDWEPHIE